MMCFINCIAYMKPLGKTDNNNNESFNYNSHLQQRINN